MSWCRSAPSKLSPDPTTRRVAILRRARGAKGARPTSWIWLSTGSQGVQQSRLIVLAGAPPGSRCRPSLVPHWPPRYSRLSTITAAPSRGSPRSSSAAIQPRPPDDRDMRRTHKPAANRRRARTHTTRPPTLPSSARDQPGCRTSTEARRRPRAAKPRRDLSTPRARQPPRERRRTPPVLWLPRHNRPLSRPTHVKAHPRWQAPRRQARAAAPADPRVSRPPQGR